jgi:hypothetical protein
LCYFFLFARFFLLCTDLVIWTLDLGFDFLAALFIDALFFAALFFAGLFFAALFFAALFFFDALATPNLDFFDFFGVDLLKGLFA